jgi:hypothetical protein
MSTVNVGWLVMGVGERREAEVMRRRTSRVRWVALCGIALLTVLMVPAPTLAAPAHREPPSRSRHLDRQVGGPFQGVPSFESRDGCAFLYQRFNLEYTADSGGSGTLDLEGCVLLDGFVYEAVFALTTPRGAVLRGTVTGTARPFTLVLTVVSSEGRGFRNVRGTIGLTGDWASGLPGFPGPASASGTLVGDLARVRH